MNFLFLLAAIEAGVDVNLLKGVCFAESSFRTNLNTADSNGRLSIGICQIQHRTAKYVGYDGSAKGLLTPSVNAAWAARYLKYQLERYKGNERKAVSAYNAGRAIKGNKSYVDKVLAYKKQFTEAGKRTLYPAR